MMGKYERDDRLEAMEMWTWKKITGITWIEHKTNNEAVSNDVNERRLKNNDDY